MKNEIIAVTDIWGKYHNSPGSHGAHMRVCLLSSGYYAVVDTGMTNNVLSGGNEPLNENILSIHENVNDAESAMWQYLYRYE